MAVHAVSLTVRGGDLVAVTGSSGAGKTSLLGALGGVWPASAGEATIDGRAIHDRDTAARSGIVLVPEGNALVRILTAAENVALAVADPRRSADQTRGRVLHALDAVGLGDSAGQLIEELSGGQQQRTAVARALALRGRVLLADEPTSELDAMNRGLVMALLRAEARRGAAVLVATHDPEAAEVCDAELRLDLGVGTWIRDDR